MRIEIMDTTLRDGEQTVGISFNTHEKLSIAKLLLIDVKVDRIEIASARVSAGEFESVKKITQWANENQCIQKIEILGFIDGTSSLDWIEEAGGKTVNMLCKGSLNHLTHQLRKSPQEHIADIKKAIDYAKSKGLKVNLYFEDWSNGMKQSPEYVFQLADNLQNEPIERIMLPDTLGILDPLLTYEFCKKMVDKYPKIHFDFHAHNDYDMATGNVFMAIKAGIKGIHTTVNGLGERAGNVPLSSVVGLLNDHLGIKSHITESQLSRLSSIVETYSGIRVPENKPIIGEYVFTQTCGVHADGDQKNNLYFNALSPERFGRTRHYALGKTSGKANILQNLKELGLDADLDADSIKKITDRVIELGDKKESVTKEDLPFIIADVIDNKRFGKNISIKHFNLSMTNGLRPVANILVEIYGKNYEENAIGDGQYDAFVKALRKIYGKLGKDFPVLSNYFVSIPPGGKSDALVETIISWKYKDKEIKTRGLSSDQTKSAIRATEKMLNLVEIM
jgi:D-citramalate synthase